VRVALVHDYLTELGGAERVVRAFVDLYPEAPLYTSVLDARACGSAFEGVDVRTTFMQRLARRKGMTKAVFPLFPRAFDRLELDQADIVLTSSSGFAHHVRPPDSAVHIAYCHNPPRFLWQPDEYFFDQPRLRLLLEPMLRRLRKRDLAAALGVDVYVANSENVAERIRRIYGRTADVIQPPVDTARFEPSRRRSGRFLVLSRLLPYKRIDLAVCAATRLKLPLDVIGDGPERRRLGRLAGGTVRFLGRQPDPVVRSALATCEAVVVPGEEDFGLVPVEAQAAGRPVVAFAAGGALETVEPGETGFLFETQTWEAVAEAMLRAQRVTFDVERLRLSAMRFDVQAFRHRITRLVCASVEARAPLRVHAETDGRAGG
jgi:glycosyltransferase involved in cell wall biosynthesis